MRRDIRLGLAISVLLVSASAIWAQFSDVAPIKTWGGDVPMALPTATCFAILSAIELFRHNGGEK